MRRPRHTACAFGRIVVGCVVIALVFVALAAQYRQKLRGRAPTA